MEQGSPGRLDATRMLLIRSFARGIHAEIQTYHIAVVLLYNYLAKTHNLPKSVLQAIGATTLFIASKLEEYQCKSSQEFA